MDDTPDKLRRNVVALAAAILAIAFFHLSFKPTGTLLGFAEVGNVSAFKVWLALSAVLLYVVLRYHHADDTRRECSYLAEQYETLRGDVVLELLQTDLQRYLRYGKPVRLLDDAGAVFDKDVVGGMDQDTRVREANALEVSVTKTERARGWWEGQVRIGFGEKWLSRSTKRSESAFRFGPGVRARAVGIALLRTAATRSRAGVDVALPYALASVAALTCLFKLAFFFAK